MDNIVLILETAFWAATKHSAQRRKGQDQEPYINHLLEVAMLTAEAGGDVIAIQIALLHDTIEDLDVTYDDILNKFGKEVADGVLELTDDPNLSTIEQKKMQVINMPKKSHRSRLVKMADINSNTRSLVDKPPMWKHSSKVGYLFGRKDVVDAGRGTSEYLENLFDKHFQKAKDQLTKTEN